MPTSAPVPFLCGPIDRNRRKSAPSAVSGRWWFTWRVYVRGHWFPFAVDNRHNLRHGRGRRFTWRCLRSWATHASPLHRSIDATAPGMPTSAPVPFLCGPIDRNRRKSAPSAVRCSRCPGWSRPTIVVDGGSPGGVYEPGDACVAPTQIGLLSTPRLRAYRDAFHVGGRFVPLRAHRGRRIGANLRFDVRGVGVRGVGVVAVDDHRP